MSEFKLATTYQRSHTSFTQAEIREKRLRYNLDIRQLYREPWKYIAYQQMQPPVENGTSMDNSMGTLIVDIDIEPSC